MIEGDDENVGQAADCCAVDSVQKRMKRVALSVNRTATTLESVAACGCTARACRKSDIGGETNILYDVENGYLPAGPTQDFESKNFIRRATIDV